jgi:hypothetical protein
MMNNNKKIQEVIDSRLASLRFDDKFAGKTVSKVVEPATTKKPFAVAIAACLCIVLTIPVLAATIPSFNSFLALVSPQIAQKLQPIEMVSEANGIKMEVVAAMNDDDTAVVYLTMQDLTGNRIDKSINLFNDYSITGTNMMTSEVVAFDQKTKTATLRLQASGGSKLNGQKVTVRINSFVSGRHEYKQVDMGIDLGVIPQNPQITVFDMNNSSGGGGTLFKIFEEKGNINILKRDEMNLLIPRVNFARISNIGLVDQRLHVQIKWSGEGVDNHGYLYLTDAAGNKIYPSNISLNTNTSEKAEDTCKYEEVIFDIDKAELAGSELKGNFVTYDRQTRGNWQTTFKMEAVTKAQEADCSIESENMKINSVSISPLGITIKGRGQASRSDNLDISATMTDGSSMRNFGTINTYTDDGRITIKYMPNSPLDIERVSAVNINGYIVKFNQ